METGQNDSFFARKWKDAEDYYAAAGFSISLASFIGLMFFLSLLSVMLAYALMLILPVKSATTAVLPVVAFFAMMSLTIGVPFYIRTNRIDRVEEALPDVLKHISAVLKAGGTVESALEEVSESDYGPLSADVGRGLKQLREGKGIDDALIEMAKNSGSKLFTRIAQITVDSRKAGAGLSEVLESIAEDTKELVRIKRERGSKATMHVAFLNITSLLLVPFIFGFTLAIVKFIAAGMSQAVQGGAQIDFSNFDVLLIFFLILQVAISNIAIGIISEGKINNKLIYIPFMMLVTLLVYQLGGFIGQTIIKGGV